MKLIMKSTESINDQSPKETNHELKIKDIHFYWSLILKRKFLFLHAELKLRVKNISFFSVS